MSNEKAAADQATASEAPARLAWLAPRLEAISVDDITHGTGGPNFDGDASPQS